MNEEKKYDIFGPRTIFLDNNFDEKDIEAKRIKAKLRELAQSSEPITLVFDAVGGNSRSALGVIETVRLLPNEIIGIVLGKADSMHAILFLMCDLRKMGENSSIHIHDLHFTLRATFRRKKYVSKEEAWQVIIESIRADFDGYWERSERTRNIFSQVSDFCLDKVIETFTEPRDIFAPEAKELGLIHEII